MRGFLWWIALLAGLAASMTGQSMVLEYQGRYNCQPGPDHLMGTVALSGDRALVGGNKGIALVDLNALPVNGTQSYLGLVSWGNPRDFYVTHDEKHVFVNTDRSGFTVAQIVGNTLSQVTARNETGVFYDKMCLAGNYLYVAAHAHGIRIFDVTQPASSTLVGRLDQGFVDAFAVAVDGTTAYVADGAGGLKIVDVTDPKAPRLVTGETLATAAGTYQDVTVKDGRVYAAAGGAGLAVYQAGQLASRHLVPVHGFAESLCWVGNHLAVGTIAGVEVFAPGTGTAVTRVAEDTSHRRGTSAALRFAEGVASSGSRLLVADWNYLELYELKPASASTQPDIQCDVQRIRFKPAGGRCRATLTNHGAGPLVIGAVTSSSPAFQVSYTGGTLQPGQSASFDIVFTGGTADGLISVPSNDPDENPLPIQVFGETSYLDPGETAPDFTVTTLIRDKNSGQLKQGSFTLSQHRGQAVWFNAYASW